jgi:hypothetical protein
LEPSVHGSSTAQQQGPGVTQLRDGAQCTQKNVHAAATLFFFFHLRWFFLPLFNILFGE